MNNEKPNKLIALGYTGGMRCYLNLSMDEALKRFEQSTGSPFDPTWMRAEEFEFNDEFWGYSIGEK